jgi:hypothetical protein
MELKSNIERGEQLELIVEKLRGWNGFDIKINESISRTANRSLDRHLSTTTTIKFNCEGAGWAISGGRLMVYGDSGHYEIAYDLVNEIEITDGSITLKEIFSETLMRQSTISLSQ